MLSETVNNGQNGRVIGTDIPDPPREMIDRIGGGDFRSIGDAVVQHLVKHAGLTPNMRVLDIGCGCGRVAAALSRFLSPEGSYEGFDVIPELVAWCQREIEDRFPRFRFQVADVYNGEYRPDQTMPAMQYRFPYPDSSFDFVVLISVFTHMLPSDVYHYLGEIARVLKPGGIVYASYFLLDDESRRSVLNGTARFNFTDVKQGYATIPTLSHEYATALFDSTVRLTHDIVGLRIDEVQLGSWRQSGGKWAGQDVIVAVRD